MQETGFDPWIRKIPWRKWQPTPVFLPGKFHGQRSLVGYCSWGCKELDMTERLTLSHFHFHWTTFTHNIQQCPSYVSYCSSLAFIYLIAGSVAGRKPILTPCWKPFLWLAFGHLYYYNHTQWLAWRTLPSAWLETKVPLFSSGSDNLSPPTCEQERLTYPFQKLAIFLEMFCKAEDPFNLIPHCLSLFILPFDFSSSLLLSLWSIKEPGIQTPIRWWFWGTSLPSSQSASSPIKVSSLPQHLVSWIHWPIMWWAAWTWEQKFVPFDQTHSILFILPFTDLLLPDL